jgi:hypothetical protein
MLSLKSPPTWTNLTPRITGEPPIGILGHGATYDLAGRRMVVVDGYSDYGADVPYYGRFAGVWSLSLDSLRWSSMSVDGERPRVRDFASDLFDAARRRVLICGGGDGAPYADTWALDLSPSPTWSRVAPEDGVPTAPRNAIYYDARRDRLVTWDATSVWSYSLSNTEGWTRTAAAGEAPSVARRQASSIPSDVAS